MVTMSIFVVSNLINVNFFFENCKNKVQKQRSYVIFFKDTMIAQKIKFLISLTSQINME
jgi:hypothetical protein